MSSCPSCKTPLNEDFGLIDCLGCGQALLIGMDGDVQMATRGGNVPPTMPEVHPQEPSLHHFEPEQEKTSCHFSSQVAEVCEEATSFDFAIEQPPLGESSDILTSPTGLSLAKQELQSLESEGADGEMVDNSQPLTYLEPSPENEIDGSNENTANDNFESVGFSSEGPDNQEFNDENTNFLAEEEIEKAKSPAPQTGLADLSAFANSAQSSLQDGFIKYKLFLGGIDTSEIKRLVFDELSDKRLLLDINKLNQNMNKGNLSIDSLSAVKASVLVHRLKSLGVTIAWDQYDIRKV